MMQHVPFHLRSPNSLYIGSQPARPANGLGIAGFVVSLVALLFTCGLLSPLGLLISLLAMLRRPRRLAIVGVLLGVVGSSVWGLMALGVLAEAADDRADRARQQVKVTKLEVQQTLMEVQRFRAQHGRMPDGIEGNKLSIQHNDAWGRPLRYEVHPSSVMVRSAGPDGAFESADDVAQSLVASPSQLDVF